ncbi:MAG: ATP-dependent DNA helicase RecQ [Acidobacteria bacterium]|nr:ATP-dependent DNA helicase RecQ [Acidobacteriota bacterium]
MEVIASLRRHFGHVSFRPGQEDVVRAVLDGRDVLAVMPTGSGKSLGFQLPALLLPGTTIIVSPLIALMKDQVDDLSRRGIRAAALHSLALPEARRTALDAARAGALRLLYVTPERFASPTFLRLLEALPVARFVVDEAHCVSEWGHDFRPDYRRLRGAAASCRRADRRPGRPPIAALTATATPEVRADIVDLLGLTEPQVIVAGFDRPNIHPSVRPVSGEAEKQQALPSLVGGRRALVYTATRARAETAAAVLRGAGIEAVIHADLPGSIEAYYQEIGRAGRDGRPATATLLWTYADVKTREFLIDHAREDDARRPRAAIDQEELDRRKTLEHMKLRRMVAHAETAACLRATILRYFGDPAAREPCGACGTCDRRKRIGENDRLLVRKILSGVARAPRPYGRRKIAAMLAGYTEDLPEGLTRLSTTGLLRDCEPRLIEQWIDAACAAGLLTISPDQYHTLTLTPLGRAVMAGRVEDVRMLVPVAVRARTSRPRRRVPRTSRR